MLTVHSTLPSEDSLKLLASRVVVVIFACTLGCADGVDTPQSSESDPTQQSMTPQVDQGVSANPTDPTDPEVCAPQSEAVSILPRSSNHEIWQLYSDLAMVPIDPRVFAQWTPLAQVRGFDHMTESRIDAQTLEEQLRTTEMVAELLVNTPAVMASCPTPVTQRPICQVHSVYDAHAQFSDQQGANCWS